MTNKKMTINDVARIAGVSKSTISRYLNGHFKHMSNETRLRIKEIIEVTGYQPSNIAQSLKRNTSQLIGVIVADIESPFSSALIKSIGDAIVNTKYKLIIANSNNCYETEKSNITSLLAQQVDGMIVNTTKMNNPFLINIANQGLPVVLADRFVNNYNFNIAYIANKEPMYEMIDHLVQEGFEHIYFFTENYEDVSPRYYRRRYFIKKMETFNDIKHQVFINNHSNHNLTIDYIKNIVEQSKKDNLKPAIICSNGVMLFHVATSFENLGIEEVDNIGLCGYDEWGWFSQVGWAKVLRGGITTVSPSVHSLGNSTIKTLLELIENPKEFNNPVEVNIDAPLKIRRSSTQNR